MGGKSERRQIVTQSQKMKYIIQLPAYVELHIKLKILYNLHSLLVLSEG